MVLRSGRLPTGGDYAFEPKWDGFRALVSRNGHLRVKSRRGWDMTSLVPELADLPDGIAVDGELVAFGYDGLPSFPRLCDRMLHGKRRIDIMLIVFDLLVAEGRDVTRRPYWERRQLLEDLELDGDAWATTPVYQDGDALWTKVCQLGLEGVVAKKRSGHYLPGRRGWIKTKNRENWRYPLEVEAARQVSRQPAQ
jgi:bifunctional non-homologous end joining protein LigD